MISLDLLETKQDELLHSIENHDFTFLSSIGAIPVLQFLSKVENTKYLFISDDLGLSQWYKDLPYQTTIYDSRFSVVKNCWLTYELVLYLLSEDSKFLQLFDFIVLDGLDQRGANSDFLISMIVNLNITERLIALQRSTFKNEVFSGFVEKYGYSSNSIRFQDQHEISTYYLADIPNDINKEILKTIDTILSMDTTPNIYDILILLPDDYEINRIKTMIQDSSITHDFSILTDLIDYKINGTHRRLILTTDSHYFQNFNHKIRYIIDSGLRKIDGIIDIPTSKNQIEHHLSILEDERASYFGMFSETSVIDTFSHLGKVDFLPFLLYLLKFQIDLNNFEFLSSPPLDNIKSAISHGVYLGLIKIDGSSYELSGIGSIVNRFQLQLNPSSVSLYTSLAISTAKYPAITVAIMKIIAMLLSNGANDLSRMIHKDPQLVRNDRIVSQSDFATLVNIFDEIIENEQHIRGKANNSNTSTNNRNPRINKFTRDEKKRIVHIYKTHKGKLIGTDYYPSNESLDLDQLHKCLLLGYQLHICKLVKNVSNEFGTNIEYSIEPVRRPEQLHQGTPGTTPLINLNNSPESLDDYLPNDIIIYHHREYIYNYNFSLLLSNSLCCL